MAISDFNRNKNGSGTCLNDSHNKVFLDKIDEVVGNVNNGLETDKYLWSMSIEIPSLTIIVDAGKVYLDVEAVSGGDISYNIAGIWYDLDCTTGNGVGGKARVELSQGTSSTVVRSICYIALSEQDGCLELYNTTATPTGAYAPVAIMGINDHATVSSHGAMVYQRTTESVEHNDKGAISWMREKMRAMGALYYSGVDPDLSITTNAGTEDDIDFHTTNGEIFQLHRQSFPNYDISTDGIWVANASGSGVLTPYQKITNLNSVHEILDGTVLNDGDSIVLTIWGAINYSDGDCKLFVNLPKDKYTVDADAQVDKNNTAITRIPYEFKTVGFPIAQLVLKWNIANNGTWTNVLPNSVVVWDSDSADISSPNYPALYDNNADVTTVLTKAGASSVRVHFDDFNTEANYDYVRLYDAGDVLKFTYHGNLGAFTSGEIVGTTVKVRFTSDGTVKRKGFHIDTLEHSATVVSGAEVIDIR